MKPSSPLSTALLAAIAIGCTSCSPLEIEWKAEDDKLSLVAHGPPGAMLVVLAGLASEPHTMPGDPSLWTTVGPDRTAQAANIEVMRAKFDANGVARASHKVGALPAEVVLVQAIALSPEIPAKALAVSTCMAVARRSGKLRIRPHVIEVLDTSVWVRIGAVAVVIALAVLLKKARVPFFRPAGVLLAATAAVVLLVARGGAPRNQALLLDAPPPFLPNRLAEPHEKLDPLDRVTRPGFHELVTRARDATPANESVVIVPPSVEWESLRDAWQAQWLLWPRHAEIFPPETDPYAQRGIYLTFDGGPKKPGARVLYKNRAGCLWSVEAGEPK